MSEPIPSMPSASTTRTIAVPIELAPTVDRMIADFRRGTAAVRPLAYRTAEAARRPYVDVPLAIALVVVAGVLIALMMCVVPRFEDLFKDFGATLPTATQRLLRFSRFVANDYGWAPIVLVALAIPVVVARLRRWPPRPRRPVPGLGSAILAVVLIGALVLITHALLILPMVTLIQAVNGGARR
jgi:hypothetical protein